MNSSSRNGAKVIWLAVHTTEGIMRATALRDWATWPGSSHAASDETGAVLTPAHGFVPYDRSAWTLRNGNAISENIEQCGWARWTRAEWLARPKLLDATARWLADRSKARGIPLVRLSAAEIRARKPGVIGHGDYTVATGDGTHTDPGPNYPWDVVLDLARQYTAGKIPGGFLMALSDDEQARLLKRVDDMAALLDWWFVPDTGGGPNSKGEYGKRIRGTHVLVAALAGQSPDIDEEKLAAALAPTLVPAVLAAVAAKNTGLTKDDVEAAIREVLGSLGTPA